MINSVNSIQTAYSSTIQPQNQMQTQSYSIPQQIANPNMHGMDALAAYNQPVKIQTKNIQPSLPTILLPEAVKSMPGERIFAPDGTLDAIVKRSDKTTAIYSMETTAPDVIKKIEYYDNATGKLTAVQTNFNTIEQGKNPKLSSCEIKNIDDFGKVKKYTCYQDGKLLFTKEIEYGQNGYGKEYTVSEDETMIHEGFGNGFRKTTILDKQGNIDEVINFDDNTYTSEHIRYKNGIPSSITRESDIPIGQIPNGKCPSTDPELVPAAPYILGYNPKTVNGEKKFYSNGSIHSITTPTVNGSIIHMFDIKGNLTGIEDNQNPQNSKSIIYSDSSDVQNYHYSILEDLGNNKEKTTVYSEDGSCEVIVYDHNTKEEKCLSYSKEGIMETYYENIGKDNEIIMHFDKQGNLINII